MSSGGLDFDSLEAKIASASRLGARFGEEDVQSTGGSSSAMESTDGGGGRKTLAGGGGGQRGGTETAAQQKEDGEGYSSAWTDDNESEGATGQSRRALPPRPSSSRKRTSPHVTFSMEPATTMGSSKFVDDDESEDELSSSSSSSLSSEESDDEPSEPRFTSASREGKYYSDNSSLDSSSEEEAYSPFKLKIDFTEIIALGLPARQTLGENLGVWRANYNMMGYISKPMRRFIAKHDLSADVAKMLLKAPDVESRLMPHLGLSPEKRKALSPAAELRESGTVEKFKSPVQPSPQSPGGAPPAPAPANAFTAASGKLLHRVDAMIQKEERALEKIERKSPVKPKAGATDRNPAKQKAQGKKAARSGVVSIPYVAGAIPNSTKSLDDILGVADLATGQTVERAVVKKRRRRKKKGVRKGADSMLYQRTTLWKQELLDKRKAEKARKDSKNEIEFQQLREQYKVMGNFDGEKFFKSQQAWANRVESVRRKKKEESNSLKMAECDFDRYHKNFSRAGTKGGESIYERRMRWKAERKKFLKDQQEAEEKKLEKECTFKPKLKNRKYRAALAAASKKRRGKDGKPNANKENVVSTKNKTAKLKGARGRKTKRTVAETPKAKAGGDAEDIFALADQLLSKSAKWAAKSERERKELDLFTVNIQRLFS